MNSFGREEGRGLRWSTMTFLSFSSGSPKKVTGKKNSQVECPGELELPACLTNLMCVPNRRSASSGQTHNRESLQCRRASSAQKGGEGEEAEYANMKRHTNKMTGLQSEHTTSLDS